MKNCNMILTEKQEKYQHYHLEKLINTNTLCTGEEILPSDQRRVIEPAKFTYCPLGKVLEKQTKRIEDQGQKQIKAMEDHGKKLVEPNELIKIDFNIDRDSIPHEEQKKYSMNLLEKGLLNFLI